MSSALNKKTVEDLQVTGKKVLVRCDFNVKMENGVITSDKRIVASLPTIKYLIEKGAKVILCSHLGRPKGEVVPEFSLAPVAARLSELLGQEVKMAKDVVGESVSCTSNDLTISVRIVGVVDIMASMNLDTEELMSSMGSMMGGMQMTSCMLLMPAPVSATLLGKTSGRYDMLQITAVDENMLDEIGAAALNYVHSLHDNYEKDCYAVTNMATYIDLLDTVINVFTIFIAAVSAISLVVGGIGVMNIMLVSITERTREIGIRKALGAKTGTIMFQFLTESIILCLIGGVIGLLLGVAAAAFVSYIMKVPLFVEPATILLAVGFSSAIGIIFGVYPAKRAANLPPIEALRRD